MQQNKMIKMIGAVAVIVLATGLLIRAGRMDQQAHCESLKAQVEEFGAREVLEYTSEQDIENCL